MQQKLTADLGFPNPVQQSEGLDPARHRNFTITSTDLIFYFDRGELMDGALGAHKVYVPRSAIPALVV